MTPDKPIDNSETQEAIQNYRLIAAQCDEAVRKARETQNQAWERVTEGVIAMIEFYWHVHHNVLVEVLTEPLENRTTYIDKHKPLEERKIRKQLLKPVKGQLPVAVEEAGQTYNKTWQAYDEAGRACDKAQEAYGKAGRAWEEAERAWDEARRAWNEAGRAYEEAGRAWEEAQRAYLGEIEALHKQECPDCPWDGHTIFPKGGRNE